MIMLTYVNQINGTLETMYISKDLLTDVLSALLSLGVTIQEIK